MPASPRFTSCTASRSRRRLVLRSLVAATVAALAAFAPLSFTINSANAATSTASWLASQVAADGSVVDPYGTEPSVDWTVNVAMALLVAGGQSEALERAVAYVEANADAYITSGTSDEAGHLSWLVFLAVFTERDPRAFGESSLDLISRLESRFEVAESGLFGTVDDYTPVTNQSLAIIALNAAGADVPVGALAWLQAQQCETPAEQAGGWQGYRAEVTSGVLAACLPATSAEFNRADAASTSFALQALAAVGRVDDPAILAGLGWFHRLQSAAAPAPGGFGQYIGDPSDPNSTALVIQAIRATDDFNLDGWEFGSGDPEASMNAWVITSGPDAGALASPYSAGAADLYASYQGLWGLTQRPLPTVLVVPVPEPIDGDSPQVGDPSTPVAPSFTG